MTLVKFGRKKKLENLIDLTKLEKKVLLLYTSKFYLLIFYLSKDRNKGQNGK